MKILYVCRLFTGLEQSLYTKTWSPTGVPTIYKIIEKLDSSDNNVRFILTKKDVGNGEFSTWNEKRDKFIKLKGLRNEFYVLSGAEFFPEFLPRKIVMLLRELRQVIKILFNVFRFKPNLIYIDHSNTISAAILARITKTPVIYRVMGVYPYMRNVLSGGSLLHRIMKWSYASPFKLVICSQDGSGVEGWLDNALKKNVDREVLINGITKFNNDKKNPVKFNEITEDSFVILFLGKLEKYKGCNDFVSSVLKLIDKGYKDITALVIGSGSQKKILLERVKLEGKESSFIFISNLPHDEVVNAHLRSDIYVSLNKLGNLSNSNLEAMSLGSCIVMPEPNYDNGVDVITKNFIGLKSTLYIPREASEDYLASSLEGLYLDSEKRKLFSHNIMKIASEFIPTWDERITCEIEILKKISHEEEQK
jgi:glycosyltransferase involved in cell wall biosynthesis